MNYEKEIQLSINYLLVKSNKEEINEIQELINNLKKSNEKYPFLDDIIIGGNINEITNNDIKDFMSLKVIHKTLHLIESKNESHWHTIITNEYECYVGNSSNIYSNTIIHEDALSSFKCACQTKNIEYFYILKQEINFNNQNEQSTITDTDRNTSICEESEIK